MEKHKKIPVESQTLVMFWAIATLLGFCNPYAMLPSLLMMMTVNLFIVFQWVDELLLEKKRREK